MNWYRLHIYGYHYSPGAPKGERLGHFIGSCIRDVAAHDAADAVYCYERSHRGTKVMNVEGVEPPWCACGTPGEHKPPCPLRLERADPLKNNGTSWEP